tara:strand:+ start:223 stop:615 length:393 start_codon:yes stop_codon:yes gene_type:complete
MGFFDMYLLLILITKILYIFASVRYKIYNDDSVLYHKIILHDVFFIEIALLILYLFNPFNNKPVVINKHHIKIYLVIFAAIVLLEIDWNEFRFGEDYVLDYYKRLDKLKEKAHAKPKVGDAAVEIAIDVI